MKPLPRETVLLLQTEGDQRLEVLPPLVQAERKSTTDKAPLGQVGVSSGNTGVTYNVGDTVRHKTFGTGVILSVKPMGNDNLLEVAFDRAGTKKLMANFAKLEKV